MGGEDAFMGGVLVGFVCGALIITGCMIQCQPEPWKPYHEWVAEMDEHCWGFETTISHNTFTAECVLKRAAEDGGR